MTQVRLTRRALADIGEIDDYSTQRWGRATADRYLDDLHAGLTRLQEQPALLRVEPELSPDLGFYLVREHLLVCDLIDGDVYVLAVVHGSMDQPRRVAELEPQMREEVRLMRARIVRPHD